MSYSKGIELHCSSFWGSLILSLPAAHEKFSLLGTIYKIKMKGFEFVDFSKKNEVLAEYNPSTATAYR